MTATVGELKARLSLDSAAFSTGLNKVRSEVGKFGGDFRQATAEAGQNVGGLVSQMGALGSMMAAGNGPLQTGISYGTQFAQALAQAGGNAGSIKALGAAFTSILNPVSLASMAVIGFGAAIVQWMRPAKAEVRTIEDSMRSLRDSMAGYDEALGISLLYTGEAQKRYGAEAQRGAELARKILVMEADKTRSAISEIISKAYSDLGFDAYGERGISAAGRIDSANAVEALDRLGFKSTWSETLFGYGGHSAENRVMAEELGNTLREIYKLVSQPVPAGGLDDYLTGLREHLDAYVDQLDALKAAGADQAELAKISEQMVPLQRALLEGEKRRADIRAADAAKAEEMLATYAREAELRALMLEYGKDSVEVAEYTAAAERDKMHALIDNLNVADDTKAALHDAADASYSATMQTWEWQRAMAAVNGELGGALSLINTISAGMITQAKINAARAVREAGGTAAEARRAGDVAGAKAAVLNGANTVGSQYFGMSEEMIQSHLDQIDADYAALDEWTGLTTDPRAPAKGGGKGKGGAGGNRLAQSVDGLRERTQALHAQAEAFKAVVLAGGDWERELAILEEEQRLLNEAQKAGVPVSEEMRATIKKLAADYVDAEDAMRQLREGQEEFARKQEEIKGAFEGAFTDWITGAKSFRDALSGVIAKLAEMAASAAFQSLLSGIGPDGGNGLFAGIARLLSFDGGGVTPSGPRSGGLDGRGGFLAMLHPDETVVDHTRGGMVGGGFQVMVAPSPYFDVHVTQLAGQLDGIMARDIDRALPGRIEQIGANRRMR